MRHAVKIALEEFARDLLLLLALVAALFLRGDHEACRATLEIPRERRVDRIVEIVHAKDRHVISIGHYAEILGMHIAQRQDRRHPGIFAQHVAVKKQRSAAEELEERGRELVELLLRSESLLVDPNRMVLEDGLAHMMAPILPGDVLRAHRDRRGDIGLRQTAIFFETAADFLLVPHAVARFALRRFGRGCRLRGCAAFSLRRLRCRVRHIGPVL